MSSGNNNLGARLVVVFLAAGIVMLGMSPINKRYGGLSGLLRRVTPEHLSIPDLKSIRSSLVSLGKSRKRQGEASDGTVYTVRPETETESRVERTSRTKSEKSGFIAGLLGFFDRGEEREGGKGRKSEGSALARRGPEGDDTASSRENTARARLSSQERTRGGTGETAPQAKPKQLDKLSSKDRQELNELLDGF